MAVTTTYEQIDFDVRDRVVSHVQSRLTVPVLHDNQDESDVGIDPTKPWVRAAIKMGRTLLVGKGYKRRYRATGVLMLTLLGPLGAGEAPLKRLADLVVPGFRGRKAGSVIWRTPSVESVGRGLDRWQVSVTCPFYADFFES